MKISIILLLKQSFKEKIDKNEIDKVRYGQLIQQFIISIIFKKTNRKFKWSFFNVIKYKLRRNIKGDNELY